MSFSKNIVAFHRPFFLSITAIALFGLTFGCTQKGESTTAFAKAENSADQPQKNNRQRMISQEWKDYWYGGKAEITSYKLEQARYGEIRQGTTTLIYVTEDFLPKVQVKADRSNDNIIPVLKLNTSKKFNTGIYPYSLMTSTFYSVFTRGHAIKISHSMQEWCGITHTQLNNRKEYEVILHSYFEGEADQKFKLPKAILENEIWLQLRFDPSELPTGNFKAIPDLSFTTMKHIKLKSYNAQGSLTEYNYTLTYPELNRTLSIHFSIDFPYEIIRWEETYIDGGAPMTTTATKIKTIKSAYWNKNRNSDEPLRKELQLER